MSLAMQVAHGDYDAHEIPSYKRWPLSITKGRGSWVEDTAGNRYLDMYGGHAVCSTGHCHPRVVAAIRTQAESLLFYSNVAHVEVRAVAAEKLASILPQGLERVFFVNSGTEANEAALKIARLVTGQQLVLSFAGGFHGRTAGSVSATGMARYWDNGRPPVPEHVVVPYGDLAAVEASLTQARFAAVILEPVQSMSGVHVADAAFLQGLRKVCDENGTLLIYDEVQTGMGRSGEYFVAGEHGVLPDLVSLGKGLASGVPMGAVAATDDVALRIKPGDLGTTFGGGPLACAALVATIDVLRDEEALANVRAVSAILRAGLAAIPGVCAVRGKGLLIGIELEGSAKQLQDALFARRILTGTAEDPRVLRLMPPLLLTPTDAAMFLAEVRRACQS